MSEENIKQFEELLARHPDGFPPNSRVILVIGEGGGAVVVPPPEPPPPPEPERPAREVTFVDGAGGSNKLVKTFDTASTQSNKAMVWEKTQGLIETAFPSGQKGYGLKTRENLLNVYTYWAWLPAGQIVKNAGGKYITWPEELKTPGGVIPYPDHYLGQFVERSLVVGSIDMNYIEALVDWTMEN